MSVERDLNAVERLRLASQTISDLLRGVDWHLFDLCACGHRRLEHLPGRLAEGREPCRHEGCVCSDFDVRPASSPLRSQERAVEEAAGAARAVDPGRFPDRSRRAA